MNVHLPVPNYTLLCRKAKSRKFELSPFVASGEAIDLVCDSTGLKVYGEEAWKVGKHGWSKHRAWRKLHIGMDEKTQKIVVIVPTDNSIADSDVVEEFLNEVMEEISSFIGEGAIEKKVQKGLLPRKIKKIIPPQENAVSRNAPELIEKNDAIRSIREIGRKS
ncbi:MAG: transposase [Bacteroidetes bacterium]|nr:transposase [Bacteroidota bacterium]